MRFMQSQNMQKSKALIAADLTPDSPMLFQIDGTITNLGTDTLKQIWLQTKNGTATLHDLPTFPSGGLPAGATMQVHLTGNNFHPEFSFDQAVGGEDNRYGYYNRNTTQPANNVAAKTNALYAIAANTIVLDSNQGHQEKPTKSTALIYAISDTATPEVTLDKVKPIEKHWLVIRAKVAMNMK